MNRLGVISLCALATCAAPDVSAPQQPALRSDDAASSAVIPNDAAIEDAIVPVEIDAAPSVAAAPPPEVWLKGCTHVHARPSGDSTTPIATVIRWYEDHAYDFIVLTDHNKVSELDPAVSTVGNIAVRATQPGLIVLAGIELTHNPSGCLPAGDPSGKCRIHVNLIGTTARPEGKVEWADRRTNERVLKYQAALEQQKTLGGIAQLNHPSWFWGMTSDLLADLARRGMPLVEISNVQFSIWNDGDKDHPSLEALWDGALAQGVTLWGVASDDAHHYDGTGQYPAGGGWVVVKARRDPQAILAALAQGHFYASTGVVLARAEVESGELVVEVAPTEAGTYTIDFIENGKRAQRVNARVARRPIPHAGYVRALVTRDDGKRAWVQPARRP
jgi:hypothetical protein